MKQLNDNIKRLMAENSIDELTLARETGVAVSTLNRLKNASNINPTIKSLEPIAQFFNISVSELIGEATGNPIYTANNKLIPLIPITETAQWINEVGLSFAIKIGSSTYEPLIPMNSIALMHNTSPSADDFVLVKLHVDPKPVFKKLLLEGSKPFLKSIIAGDNAITELKSEDLILGVVYELRFSFKESKYTKPSPALLEQEHIHYSGVIYALIPS